MNRKYSISVVAAIFCILGVVAAQFVLGMPHQTPCQNVPERFSIGYEQSTTSTGIQLQIQHEGGDTIDPEQLIIQIEGRENRTGQELGLTSGFSAGDTLTVQNLRSGQAVRIYFQQPATPDPRFWRLECSAYSALLDEYTVKKKSRAVTFHANPKYQTMTQFRH